MASPLADILQHRLDVSHPIFPTTAPRAGPASTNTPGPPVSGGSPFTPIQPPSSHLHGTYPSATSSQTSKQGNSHSNGQSLYQCADCLKRYSRPEHLQRHIASHTLGKRFQCDICSKAFARADLLKRHRTNHAEENGTKRRRIDSSPGAGRVARACQGCAKARVKCDEVKPCTRCKSKGITCEYGTPGDAAMHLLHLSATAHNTGVPPQQDGSPGSRDYHGSLVPSRLPPLPEGGPSMTADTAYLQSEDVSTHVAHNALPREEPQILTPETMDQSNSEISQPQGTHAMLEMSKAPFSDFLRDILYDQAMGDQARFTEPQGLAVLDFCDDGSLELNDIDFGLLDDWNIGGVADPAANMNLQDFQSKSEVQPADMDKMRQRLVQVWTKSPWKFNPQKTDNRFNEQGNLPLPTMDASQAQLYNHQRPHDRILTETLNPAGRDKILAIVLNTCRNSSVMSRVASSFPSAEVMDSWIHIFVTAHASHVCSFVHYPTLSLNVQWPEWLATAASAGAVLAPIPTLRRFGFALQEAVRVTIPSRFEENNKSIADISPVQALVMVQDIGLWSGNRRKMEIAECHMTVPIAMMRYRGKFHRSHYPQIIIDAADSGKTLEDKWKKWSDMESWKRLVFHAYLRDAQVSMTQFGNMSMSYADLTLPLPASRDLWESRTAEEFKDVYLERGAGEGKPAPCLGDLLRDINLLAANRRRLDMRLATSIYLHGFWALIWEYRQKNAVFRAKSENPTALNNINLLLSSQHHELCQMLQTFQMAVTASQEAIAPQEFVVLHLLQLNLHVSLDDLQLFAGKDGDDEARRIYPTLQRWSESQHARQALWHAGQILRQAKLFPTGHLKDFYAIAVHHAALCIWAYGVVIKAMRRRNSQLALQYTGPLDSIYLDDEDSALVQRYIAVGHGRPAIRGPRSRDSSPHVPEGLVEDPKSCMEVTQDILRVNFVDGPEGLPPISENIVHLLKQLGNAAWAVGLTSQ